MQAEFALSNKLKDELDNCPHVSPNYKGPTATLDNYPELVKKIQTQTARPESVIIKLRESLDVNILNLNASKLSVQNIENIILPFLVCNPQITELRISGNDIGDAGATLLAKSLTVQKLEVIGNNITDIGINALCQNKNIVCLNVMFNNLTEKAIETLANNSTLTELRISLDQLHQNLDSSVLKFFLKNDTLNTFRCSGVLGVGVSARAILDSFQKELIEQRKLREKYRQKSFLMGCHPRAGQNSPILTLYKKGGKVLLPEIFSYIKPASFKLIP